MKKTLIVFTILFLFIFFTDKTFSQEQNLKKIATFEIGLDKNSSTEKRIIQNLKDKIATKVTELRNSTKKVIKGTVYSFEKNVIKIINENNQIFSTEIDDLTNNFYKLTNGSKTKIKKDDLKNNDHILAYGSFIDNSVSLDRIYLYLPKRYFDGTIVKINPDYSIQVESSNRTVRIFDIEQYTKQKILDSKNLKISSSGFSKFKEGDYVMIEYEFEKDSTRSSALRSILIPQESL